MKRTALLAALIAAAATSAAAQPREEPRKPPPPQIRGELTNKAGPAQPTAADWRTPNPDDVLVIQTNKGRILVEMIPEAAPLFVARVKELTRQGFYDNRTFFRVIDAFMAQTGDPQDNGQGGSPLPDVPGEFTFRRGPDTPFVNAAEPAGVEVGFIRSLPVMSQSMMLSAMTVDGKVSAWPLFCPGVAGVARAESPDSANSQFFLMRQAYPSLEKRYAAWGRVISGLDVVRAIKTGEPVAPPQDRMERVRILADLPPAERPKVRVIDPKSAWFKNEIARVRAFRGADFSACDMTIPAEVR